MNQTTYFIISLACLFSTTLCAQFNVNGSLQDANQQALPFANILVKSVEGVSQLEGGISEDDGTFSIRINQAGKYQLEISVLGFKPYQSVPFELNSAQAQKNFGVIILEENTEQLEGVTVTGSVPLFQRKIDRTVVNIENRINTAGSSALEILERSPGVVVNRQGNSIAMLGKEGVNIMINGKLQYMTSDALFGFLEGLSADNIKSLELITTPPANFDAQGNAGFINLVLKKSPDDGFNGGYTLSGGFGRGETSNASLNFNYRKNRINLFGSYNYLRKGQEQTINLERVTGTGSDVLETLFQSDRNPTQNNHNFRLGLDVEASEKTTLGFLISGYNNRWDMDADNRTEILPAAAPDTLALFRNVEENYWQHFQGNFNLLHTFTNKSVLNLDFDYLAYDNQNPVTYDLRFEGRDGTLFDQSNLASEKNTPFTIIVGKFDYEIPLGEKAKLSVGTKYVTSEFENAISLTDDGVVQPNFTSVSDLSEDIFALYAQGDYQLSEKTTLKAGLRYENTDSELNSTNGGRVVDRRLDNLFPSIFINRKLGEYSSVNLSYARRIDRPSFSSLAPFVIFLDPNTSFGGNAGLRPALANTFQLDYNKKQFSLSAQYTDEDFTIVGFQNRFDPVTNTQLIVPDNLEGQKTASLTTSFPIKVTNWWKFQYFSTLLWQESTTVEDLGTFTLNQTNFRINGTQTMQLGKDWSWEVNGFYQGRSLFGNIRVDPIWILNSGIQKKFKNGSRLAFNVTDIFNNLVRIGRTSIPEENVLIQTNYDFSQTTFKVSYSATLGNQSLKKQRERETGAEDEKNRVN